MLDNDYQRSIWHYFSERQHATLAEAVESLTRVVRQRGLPALPAWMNELRRGEGLDSLSEATQQTMKEIVQLVTTGAGLEIWFVLRQTHDKGTSDITLITNPSENGWEWVYRLIEN